ncbi:MAG TPA: hypothetical protein VK866_18160 [Acidimicrobiales bacterium]|nr:hypothetical protein [Acidimicrobiales bacterium]
MAPTPPSPTARLAADRGITLVEGERQAWPTLGQLIDDLPHHLAAVAAHHPGYGPVELRSLVQRRVATWLAYAGALPWVIERRLPTLDPGSVRLRLGATGLPTAVAVDDPGLTGATDDPAEVATRVVGGLLDPLAVAAADGVRAGARLWAGNTGAALAAVAVVANGAVPVERALDDVRALLGAAGLPADTVTLDVMRHRGATAAYYRRKVCCLRLRADDGVCDTCSLRPADELEAMVREAIDRRLGTAARER